MTHVYEELAREFIRVPVVVHGVYRTSLAAGGVYNGHMDRPTTKCGILIALNGQADFIYNGTDRYLMEPGKVLGPPPSSSCCPTAANRDCRRPGCC